MSEAEGPSGSSCWGRVTWYKYSPEAVDRMRRSGQAGVMLPYRDDPPASLLSSIRSLHRPRPLGHCHGAVMSKTIVDYPGQAIRDDTQRLTYSELADARGISRTSAERLARRKRWPRVLGNDGVARVIVPLSATVAEPAGKADRVRPVTTADSRADINRAIREAIREVTGPLAMALADSLAAERRAREQAAEAIAAEAIARTEAAGLCAELERRGQWGLMRRLRWALFRRG
jgi:hypothetical protein